MTTPSRHPLSEAASLAIAETIDPRNMAAITGTRTLASGESGFLRRYFSFLVGENMTNEDRQFAMEFDDESGLEDRRRLFGFALGIGVAMLLLIAAFSMAARAESSPKSPTPGLSQSEPRESAGSLVSDSKSKTRAATETHAIFFGSLT